MKLRLLTLTALVASMFTPLWAQSNAIPGTGTTNDISSVAINGTGAITITPRIGPNALPANNVPVDNTPAGLAFMPGSAGFLGTEISPSDSIPGPGATTVGPTSIALYTISKNTATVVPTGASDAFVGYGTITNTPTPYWTYPTITAGLTPGSFSGLAYAADDFSLGSGTTSTSFYTIRHALSGTDYFTTIVYTSEAVVDLKPMSQGGGPGSTGLSGYFSLTYATSSPGTAGNNMWYLRTAGASDHFLLNGDIGANATAGNTLLGWMAPALASGSNDILDLNASTTKGSFGGTFAAVSGYTAMHFLPASPTVGNYTGDRFYYLRLDASVGNGGTGNTILGFINTTAGSRTISDIANLGAVYSTLTFIPSSAGTTTSGGAAWGSNQLYVAGPTPTTTQQVSFAAIGDQNVGVPFNVSPSASSNGAITLTVDAGSIGTATISPVGGVGPSGSTFIVTPTSPGLVRLRATQPGGAFTANFMQQSFFILGPVTTLAIPSKTLIVATLATPFTPVTATGGTGLVTFSVLPLLPAGLNFNLATGEITGTPGSTLVATNYTVTATDVALASSSKTFSLTIAPALTTTLAVASTTLTVGTPATSFTPVTASGGTGAITFTLTAGTLPTGLSLSTAGAITGTPTVASGATNYTITATDSAVPALTSSKAFSLTVNNAALSTTLAVASTTLTVGAPAASFTPVTSSGGTGAVTFTLTAGTLPAGLSLSTAGAITGTPSVTSVATNYTITATDSAVPAATSSKAFSLTVNNAGLSTTLAVASTTLTVGTPATSFTPVTSSGGTGAVTFAVTAGTLPAGLSLSSAGAITGTPSVASVATNYTITATDSAVPPATSSKAFSLTVSATPSIPLSIAAPYAAAGTVGAPFSYTIVATPAPSDYNSSPLPAGLSLNRTTGLLSGTPTVAGTFLVTLEVRNQSGTGAAVLTLTFTPASVAPIITGVLSAPGTVGLSFGPYTIVASGSPTAFSASSLPSGLVLNPVSGVITGTPVAAGVTIVTLTATNAAGSSTAGLTITVTPAGLAPLFISSPRASGAVGVTFVTYVSLATGTPSSFNAVGLPPGLSINPLTGAINGTPTAAGTFTVTLSATNATGTGTGTLTLVIATALTEPSSRIVNFAARAISGPGSESLIMGFVVSGDGKNLLVRGIGPGLTPYGVITALADPFLTLYGPTGVIATNDDWQINQPGQADSLLIAATAARVGAFALPTASKDSSLLLIVNNGAHTTGLVRPNSTTGVALTEIYDTDVALGARLTNVSARMNVTAGEGTLIAGLVIAGNAPKTVLIRGVGPTLSLFGVAGVLANPTITVFAGSNSIATNDDWETGASSAAQITAASVRVGAFALQAGSKDAALLVTLEPGTYTVQVTGVANTTGVALVEIYDTL